jgi:hypothetical protein
MARWRGRGPASVRSSQAIKLALVVGVLSLAFGVFRAHREPATSYELSMYAATPLGFWAGAAIALVVAVGVGLSRHRDRFVRHAVLLGGAATLAIAALPTVRDYYFYGLADSLTHLGWTRAIRTSAMNPFELTYPTGHLYAGSVSELLGTDVRHAMGLVVVVFVALYFLFLVLTVRALIPEWGAVVATALIGFALLPLLNVGAVSLMFIPFMLAILFTPFILFLLVLYVGSPTAEDAGRLPVTRLDAMVLVTGLAFLWLHPQAFSDVLVLLGTITVVQYLYRRRNTKTQIAAHRWIAGQFAVLSALFLAWNANHPAARSTVDAITASLLGGGPAGEVVTQRGASLTEIGASLPELFVKLYLVETVVLAFALWLVVSNLRSRPASLNTDLDAWSRYLSVASVLLALYAGVHFFGTVSSYFFRHLSFGMVIGSVFGAVGVHLAVRGTAHSGRAARIVAAAIVLVALGLSLATVFPSPYIYSQSHHVTASQMSGYQAAFEHRADSVEFSGVRGGAERYSEALPSVPTIEGESLFGDAIRAGLGSHVAGDSYFVVTATDKEREIEAYRELRVTESDLDSLDAQTDLHRVQSNGEFVMYYVDGNASTAPATSTRAPEAASPSTAGSPTRPG